MSEAAKELLNYGVLGLMLLLFIGASVSIAMWLKPRLEKLFESHLSLMTTLQKTQEEHTSILRELKEAFENLYTYIQGQK